MANMSSEVGIIKNKDIKARLEGFVRYSLRRKIFRNDDEDGLDLIKKAKS